MEPKFKPGDIIRVADEKDIAFEYNNFYEVIGFCPIREHYDLKSLQFKYVKNVKDIFSFHLLVTNNPPKVAFKEGFEEAYRVVTTTELLLYGPKKVQKDK